MDRQPTPTVIATLLMTAPAWCRVALSVADERMRRQGAMELARIITDEPGPDPRQLALPSVG